MFVIIHNVLYVEHSHNLKRLIMNFASRRRHLKNALSKFLQSSLIDRFALAEPEKYVFSRFPSSSMSFMYSICGLAMKSYMD